MPRADHLLRIAAELGADPVRLVFGEDSEEYRRINGAWPDAYTDRAAARAAKQRHLLATIVDAFIDECQRQADQAAASGK